jgi:hypothetical protein
MLAIWDAYKSGTLLGHFVDMPEYVQHLWGGTRRRNLRHGLTEIPKKWDK